VPPSSLLSIMLSVRRHVVILLPLFLGIWFYLPLAVGFHRFVALFLVVGSKTQTPSFFAPRVACAFFYGGSSSLLFSRPRSIVPFPGYEVAPDSSDLSIITEHLPLLFRFLPSRVVVVFLPPFFFPASPPWVMDRSQNVPFVFHQIQAKITLPSTCLCRCA